MTTTREEFEARMHAECFQEPPSYCVDLAWAACQAAHLAGQRAMQARAAKLLGDTAENRRKSPRPHYGIPFAFEKAKEEVLALEVKP